MSHGFERMKKDTMTDSNQTSTYSVPVSCGNCGYSGKRNEKKGTRTAGFYECPRCGCMTLYASWKIGDDGK
jgi:ribosomal protein S27AE